MMKVRRLSEKMGPSEGWAMSDTWRRAWQTRVASQFKLALSHSDADFHTCKALSSPPKYQQIILPGVDMKDSSAWSPGVYTQVPIALAQLASAPRTSPFPAPSAPGAVLSTMRLSPRVCPLALNVPSISWHRGVHRGSAQPWGQGE